MATVAVDAGHFSFLELIKIITQLAGPAFTAGALLKTGISGSNATEVREFSSREAFLQRVEDTDNPIAHFEGTAVHYGGGVFGLPVCPFAGSIESYKSFRGGLPGEYGAVTERINKSADVQRQLHVGQGAAVSPFCAIHQPIRSKLGSKVKINGKFLHVYQLGCKWGHGQKGLAADMIQ